jgi:hypothetical protein
MWFKMLMSLVMGSSYKYMLHIAGLTGCHKTHTQTDMKINLYIVNYIVYISNGYQGLFPCEVKWLGHEADHSLPSNAKVKNAWSFTSTPPICLHGIVLS